MSALKIKKGDKVVILSGKDKGKTGEVTKAFPKDSKVVVSGVNIATRHRKATQANPQGGLDRFEAPLHVSNVAIATADDRTTAPTTHTASPRLFMLLNVFTASSSLREMTFRDGRRPGLKRHREGPPI